ncbi:uncharacterized protein LOC134655801 [Cydia amplana]|uniref:uncharacterized protein LOC134655801 n=1 Tax=Cydia amplana TaxID=1869771 RepID=UPI002FE63F98
MLFTPRLYTEDTWGSVLGVDNFHSLPCYHTRTFIFSSQTEAGRMLFTPRLYTEDTWGSVLGVDNFHSLPCYHTRTFIFSSQTEAGRMLFTPRLYTEDTWGSVLGVDNFHSLPCYHTRTFIFSSQTEAGRMLFTPRLYTEDTWGSVLGVDNFHSLPCYHTRTFIFSSQTEAGRMLFTPRLYTEDTWGSVLGVDNFHSLPCYHTRTFIFSSKSSMGASSSDRLTEWTVDLYPKGVWFKKSMLIVWSGTFDVPEVVLRTVRVSITCQNPPDAPDYDDQQEPDVRVKIGLLVWGVQKGVEHIASVVERVHRFSAQNRVLNIDGALDFDSLNTPLYSPACRPACSQPAQASASSQPHKESCPKCSERCDNPEPKHLLGPNRDQLRIQVVIVPLTDYCHVGIPDTVT